MRTSVWSNEIVEFLKTLPLEMKRQEMADAINRKFNTNITCRQVTNKISLIYRDKKKNKIPLIFTKEQYDYFLQINENNYIYDVVNMMNEKFSKDFTVDQIRNVRYSRGLLGKVDTRFKKNHTPYNKGTKGVYGVGGNSGSFKKGMISLKRKPCGSERIEHGYRMIKVADTGVKSNDWKTKARLVWEKHNGEIPQGYKITYLDGNKLNTNIENLIMVNDSELLSMVNYKFKLDDPELTKVGFNIVKLKNKIKELEKLRSEKIKNEEI